jgi:hypothetical protein
LRILPQRSPVALPNHPLDEALSDAILATLQNEERQAKEHAEHARWRSIIDHTPSVRARLFDYTYRGFDQLSELLVERLQAEKGDLRGVLTVRVAVTVLGVALDLWRESGGCNSPHSIAAEAMRLLQEQAVVLPRPRG